MRARHLAIIVLMFTTSKGFPQVSGDVPNANRINAYVTAFNAGDDAMAAFVKENVAESALRNRSVADRVTIYRQMHDRLKTIGIKSVPSVEVSGQQLSVTVRMKSSSVGDVDIVFLFEPAPPNKLIALRVEDAEGPASQHSEDSAPAAKVSESEFTKKVSDYLDEATKRDEFSGVVLIARGGKPVLEKAYGFADKGKQLPNNWDTKFNLGSINKIFTRICIDQLVSQGKLAYADKLGNLLPDYPNKDAREKVTIAHLLTMRSGIGDFFGERYDATPKSKLRNLADYLPLFADQPLLFEPGTKSQYSNGGYVVLGLIIEKVTGQSYYQYVKQHVFDPAGMNDTESYFTEQNVPNRAAGYTLERSKLHVRLDNVFSRPNRGSSAGGGYSTAADMLNFTKALSSGNLTMYSAETGKPEIGAMGIAGGAPGINAALDFDPRSGNTIIVLSNYDPPAATNVATQVRTWIRGL